MNEEKMRIILEAMRGITYLEWTKLANAIEATFKAEATNLKNELKMANPDTVSDSYKRLF